MKKILLLSLIFCFGCSVRKPLGTSPDIVQEHPRPITVYEIGEWNAEYVILNLVDSKKEHFNIRVRHTDNIKIGAIYQQ
ncbi:MAG: hypothetical protein M3N14_00005 [Bacteroidota bacterium]|nr:hypothetical protein [Bacteroidota bacterium]